MNQFLGAFLTVLFFGGVGLFQIAQGVSGIRSSKRSSLLGFFRILFGLFMLLIPILLYIWTQGTLF